MGSQKQGWRSLDSGFPAQRVFAVPPREDTVSATHFLW